MSSTLAALQMLQRMNVTADKLCDLLSCGTCVELGSHITSLLSSSRRTSLTRPTLNTAILKYGPLYAQFFYTELLIDRLYQTSVSAGVYCERWQVTWCLMSFSRFFQSCSAFVCMWQPQTHSDKTCVSSAGPKDVWAAKRIAQQITRPTNLLGNSSTIPRDWRNPVWLHILLSVESLL